MATEVTMPKLGLTMVLDGFIAAQFLGRVKELIEQPLLLL